MELLKEKDVKFAVTSPERVDILSFTQHFYQKTKLQFLFFRELEVSRTVQEWFTKNNQITKDDIYLIEQWRADVKCAIHVQSRTRPKEIHVFLSGKHDDPS